MAVPVVGGLIAAIGGFAGVLVLKEASDFVQIGLIMYQQARRFSGSRTTKSGHVSIDGGTVRVSYGGQTWTVPIDEAAAAAGVAGAGGRGSKPAPAPAPEDPQARWIMGRGPAVAVQAVPAPEAVLSRPAPGQDREVAVRRPALDNRPFTFREYVEYMEGAKDAREEAGRRGAQEIELLRQAGRDRLARMDAEIEREKIAAQRDVARQGRVLELQKQRERIAADVALQERKLGSEEAMQRERLDAAAAAQERKFALQADLDEAERKWKSTEAEKDRKWRASTQEDMARLAWQQREWAAHSALERATEAAKRMAHILRWSGLRTYGGVVEFGKAFARF